jgi:hypothetical protein
MPPGCSIGGPQQSHILSHPMHMLPLAFYHSQGSMSQALKTAALHNPAAQTPQQIFIMACTDDLRHPVDIIEHHAAHTAPPVHTLYRQNTGQQAQDTAWQKLRRHTGQRYSPSHCGCIKPQLGCCREQIAAALPLGAENIQQHQHCPLALRQPTCDAAATTKPLPLRCQQPPDNLCCERSYAQSPAAWLLFATAQGHCVATDTDMAQLL